MSLPHSTPRPPVATEVVVLPIDTRHIVRVLAAMSFVLIIVGVGTSFVYDAVDRRQDWWFRFVDVNGEGNLPSWFSVLLLAGVALLFFAIARVRRTKDLGLGREWWVLGWFVLAMSLDEMTSIHEAVGGQIDEHVSLPIIGGYAWIAPGALIAAGVAVYGWRVLRGLPGHARHAMVVAAGVFLVGALGLEVVEAMLTDESGTFGTGPKLVTGGQELFEMLGMVLLVRTSLRELRRLSAYVGTASVTEDATVAASRAA
jgi:hypothetical protein